MLRRIINDFAEFFRTDTTADYLKYFLIADERLEIILHAGEQYADCLRGAFLGLAQSFNAAHPRQFLSRHDDVNGRVAERVQCFGAACRTVYCVAFVEPGT